MDKTEFLQKSDVNLLDYDVSDTVDQQGNEGFGVILKVKTVRTIFLTKENLQHLLSEIEAAEKNGVDYLDDDDN